MNDLFPDAPVPLLAQIACVRREISLRERVYPRWVDSGRMTADLARHELAGMRAVLETLLELHAREIG